MPLVRTFSATNSVDVDGSQVVTGGLTLGPVAQGAEVTSGLKITTGDVTIDSGNLTLSTGTVSASLVTAPALSATSPYPAILSGMRFIGITSDNVAPSGSSRSYLVGDVIIGTAGSIFVCTASGAPGSWGAASSTFSFGSPVSVTGGAILFSGISNSVARADHVHGTANLAILDQSNTFTKNNIITTSNSLSSAFSSLTVNANDTSSTPAITKTAVSITTNNGWVGSNSVSRGLYVSASGGFFNYAAIFDQGNVGINTTAPGSSLDVKGIFRLSGSSSGYVGLTVAPAAGATTYTLPTSDGTTGQVLATDGSGNMSWTSKGTPSSAINFATVFGTDLPTMTGGVTILAGGTNGFVATSTGLGVQYGNNNPAGQIQNINQMILTDISNTPVNSVSNQTLIYSKNGSLYYNSSATGFSETLINQYNTLTATSSTMYSSSPNDSIKTVSIKSSSGTDVDMAIVASGFGATIAQVPDNLASGGKKRGSYATDFQKQRTSASSVASGQGSFIGSGSDNAASGVFSIAVGGASNSCSGYQSAIVGGTSNTISGMSSFSFIGSGGYNTVNASSSVIGGGISNTINAYGGTIAGGSNNSIPYSYTNGAYTGGGASNNNGGDYSVINGGFGNIIGSSGRYSVVLGGVYGNNQASGKITYSNYSYDSTAGSQQFGITLLHAFTVGTTPTRMTSDGNNPSATNTINIFKTNQAYAYTITIVARQSGNYLATNYWIYDGLLVSGSPYTNVALLQNNLRGSYTGGIMGASVSISADGSYGGLAVTATGTSAAIKWTATVQTTEVAH